MLRPMFDLETRRARRWWQTGRPIGSITRAAAFVEDVGFALLFPMKTGTALPSMWEAVTDRPLAVAEGEWGPDIERVWAWKDQMPMRGLAWYGKFVRGRGSFLSPSMLADLYPRSGRPDDFEEAGLSPDGHRVCRILLRSGALPSFVPREAAGMFGKQGNQRYSKVLLELGRALAITNFGTEPMASGWPSAVIELTARAFAVPSPGDRRAARLRAAERFLSTVLATRAYELGNAFGWRADPARSVLEELVAAGRAERDGALYLAVGVR